MPPAAHPDRVAGNPGGRRRIRNAAVWYNSCLLPAPGRLLALCAVVRGLGKGHGDAHPFMPQYGNGGVALSPAAGTTCAAALSFASIINR